MSNTENIASKETLTKLRVPLPPEAIKPHPTKNYLSQINAIYVVERINDVFGLGRWRVKNEIIREEPAGIRVVMRKGEEKQEWRETMVIVKATFEAWLPGSEKNSPEIYVESFGGNDNDDLGDAYKGACTDALTKIGSYLGIAADVWKDKNKAGNTNQPQQPQAPKQDASQLSWVNKGTERWEKIAIMIAGFIKAKPGTTAEEHIQNLREKHKVGISGKDKPEMLARIAQIMKGEQS